MIVQPVPENATIIAETVNRYLAKFNMIDPMRPLGKLWWGFYEGEELLVLYGYGRRQDGGLEITDFYVMPNRRAVAAVPEIFGIFKAMLENGTIPYAIAPTFYANRKLRKWVDRYLGRPNPDAVIYVFKGA